MDIDKEKHPMNKKKRRLFHFAITFVIIVIGALGLKVLVESKPELKKRKTTVQAPIVRTIKIKIGPQSVLIQGEGTVRPLREINLVPQVAGKVVYMSESLVNGGEFKNNDILLCIEPVDYKLAVTLAKAKVKDAESKLRFAEENAAAAQEEWRLLHQDGAKTNKKAPPLVAKEPQLAAAQAKLEANKADLKKALLNLERTELKAPFDGRVSQENVDTGQYVSPGKPLASLYSTIAAEIVLPLEDENLLWFHVPGFTPGDGPGSLAEIKARIAGHKLTWTGKVVRAEGKLDERTRMINVIVRVEKPYAKKPPLAVGLFVTVSIRGRSISDAAVIPRSALHQNDTAWVVAEGKLHFRKVHVARFQGDNAIIKSGLRDGEEVVVSLLKTVSDGMRVRTAPAKEINGS